MPIHNEPPLAALLEEVDAAMPADRRGTAGAETALMTRFRLLQINGMPLEDATAEDIQQLWNLRNKYKRGK